MGLRHFHHHLTGGIGVGSGGDDRYRQRLGAVEVGNPGGLVDGLPETSIGAAVVTAAGALLGVAWLKSSRSNSAVSASESGQHATAD